VAEGHFVIDDDAVVPEGVVVQGVGPTSSTLEFRAANLTLESSTALLSLGLSEFETVTVAQSDHVTFANLLVSDFGFSDAGGGGIRITESSDVLVVESWFRDAPRGEIGIGGSTDVVVARNLFDGTSGVLASEGDIIIAANVFRLGYEGAFALRTRTGVRFVQNIVEGGGNGVIIFGIDAQASILNNVMRGTSGAGVLVIGPADWSDSYIDFNAIDAKVAYGYRDAEPGSPVTPFQPSPGTSSYLTQPAFVDAERWDYRLCSGSYAVDGGDPDVLDRNGSRSDLGVYGGPAAGPCIDCWPE
jgi:hypothetical protein